MNHLEYALRYAALGYYVIPVRAGEKRPDTPNGASDASNDPEVIRQWWGAKPKNNIGIVCKNCLVLDLDKSPAGDGREEFKIMREEIKGIPTSGPVAITGGGGQHWFFKKPALDLKASTHITYNGKKTSIDIRTGNTFVVVAPSNHKSGNRYKWKVPLVPVEELPALPDSLFTMFNPAAPTRQAAVTSSPITASVMERCRKYIDSIEGAKQGQNGSAKTLHAANAIFFDFGLSEVEGWPILLEFNSRCEPPWSERELRHKMEDALSYSRQDGRPRGWRAEEEFGDGVDINPAIKALEEQYSKMFAPKDPAEKDFRAWLEQRKKDPSSYLIGIRGTDVQIASPSWLWRDHILGGELTLFAGKGGTGKTTLVMELAAQITRGETWPDGSPCPLGNVLYFHSEDRIDQTLMPRFLASGGVADRIEFIQYKKEKVGRQQFTFRDLDLLRDKLEYNNDLFGEGAVKAIVFDPITAFVCADNDNNNAAVRSALSLLPDLLDEFNLACFGICHTKKGMSQFDSAADSVSGASAYVNLARAVYAVYFDKKNERRVCLPAKWNIGKTPAGIEFDLIEKVLVDSRGNQLDPIACASIVNCEYDEDADQYLTRKYQERTEELGAPSAAPSRNDCAEFIVNLLGSGDLPINCAKRQITGEGVYSKAVEAGYSIPTISRALQDSRITKYVMNRKTYVTINPTPEKIDPPASDDAARAGADFISGLAENPFDKYSQFKK